MTSLNSWNVTALCVTNRVQFVPNILRQWRRMDAGNLVVVIDYDEGSKNTLTAFSHKKIQRIGHITYQPKVSNVDGLAIIEWDRVKVVVASGRTTLGHCRNLAMRFTDTHYFTWMDDDDMQRRYRVPALILFVKGHKDYFGKFEKKSILVKGGLPLLDAKTGFAQLRKKKLSWLEGIYYKPAIKPFPDLSMSEDYHWMLQFSGSEVPETIRVNYPAPLAVHIKHDCNTSDVKKLSMSPDYWPDRLKGLEPCWAEVFKQWQLDLGLGLFVDKYMNVIQKRAQSSE